MVRKVVSMLSMHTLRKAVTGSRSAEDDMREDFFVSPIFSWQARLQASKTVWNDPDSPYKKYLVP